jgi:hypothetical protein
VHTPSTPVSPPSTPPTPRTRRAKSLLGEAARRPQRV